MSNQEFKRKNKAIHYDERVAERSIIKDISIPLDIQNQIDNWPQVKEELIKRIQTKLKANLAKLEVLPLPSHKLIIYNVLLLNLSCNNKPVKANIISEFPHMGDIYVAYLNNGDLTTFILRNSGDNLVQATVDHINRERQKSVANKFSHLKGKYSAENSKLNQVKFINADSVDFIDLKENHYLEDLKVISDRLKDTTVIKTSLSPEELPYRVRTDYRKDSEFKHDVYGSGVSVNSSSGLKGDPGINGKLDWLDVKFEKPYLSNGKLQHIRRIPNVYSKTYFKQNEKMDKVNLLTEEIMAQVGNRTTDSILKFDDSKVVKFIQKYFKKNKQLELLRIQQNGDIINIFGRVELGNKKELQQQYQREFAREIVYEIKTDFERKITTDFRIPNVALGGIKVTGHDSCEFSFTLVYSSKNLQEGVNKFDSANDVNSDELGKLLWSELFNNTVANFKQILETNTVEEIAKTIKAMKPYAFNPRNGGTEQIEVSEWRSWCNKIAANYPAIAKAYMNLKINAPKVLQEDLTQQTKDLDIAKHYAGEFGSYITEVQSSGDGESWSLEFKMIIPKSVFPWCDNDIDQIANHLEDQLEFYSPASQPGGSYAKGTIAVNEEIYNKPEGSDNVEVNMNVDGGLDI